MSKFYSLGNVQAQPWRIRYLAIEELAIVMHDAEESDDDLTVAEIGNYILERDVEQVFRAAYHREAQRRHGGK